jgi:hypothetical protein
MDNVTRLLAVLDELDAEYRDDPRNLRPNASHLVGPGHQLLQAGNLKFDLLGAIDWGGGYDELLPFSEVLSVGEYSVRVLTLEKLAEIKRHPSRPKDKLMLLHLEAALAARISRERKRAEGHATACSRPRSRAATEGGQIDAVTAGAGAVLSRLRRGAPALVPNHWPRPRPYSMMRPHQSTKSR